MPLVKKKPTKKVVNQESSSNGEDFNDPIKLFEFHGVVFKDTSGNQRVARCPFCKKPGKFYVNQENGKFECKSCLVSGNKYSFLQKIYDYWYKKTKPIHYKKLAKVRRLPSLVYKKRKLAFREDDGTWLLPSKNSEGSMSNIGTFSGKKGDRIYRTPGCKLHLGNIDRLKPHGPIYLVEGDWDGFALDFLLSRVLPAKEAYTVLDTSAGTFKEEWYKFFKNRDVILVGDNDEPGEAGVKKKADILHKLGVRSLKRVYWPESYDEGYDLNDFIADNSDSWEECWDALKCLIKPASKETATKSNLNITKFSQVIEEFKKHIFVTQNTEDAIAILLAVTFSAREEIDPLWLFLTGPPGSAKTLLLQNFAGNEWTHFESSLTGKTLVSGWKSSDGEDNSLLPQIIGKTLIVKDWTEIMSKPTSEQEEIYGVFRGAYDGRVERSFGNGLPRRVYPDPDSGHKTCHFSLLAGVTHKIFGDNRASMGERFIKFRLESEDRTSQVKRAVANTVKSFMPEFACREVISSFLQKEVDPLKLPVIPQFMENRIVYLAEIASSIRVQVERRQGEMLYRPEAEVATRLAKQLIRLVRFVSFVYGEKTVSNKSYRLVQKVAMDTCYSFHQDVFRGVAKYPDGVTKTELANEAKMSPAKVERCLFDLFEIDAVCREKDLTSNGKKPPKQSKELGPQSYLWKLSPSMRRAYTEARLGMMK